MIEQSKVLQVVENLGILSGDQVDRALSEQQEDPRSISRILTDLGYISGDQFKNFLLSQLGVAPAPVEVKGEPEELMGKVDFDFAREHHLAPIAEEGETLVLATDDPLNLLAADNIRQFLETPSIDIRVTTLQSFDEVLRAVYSVEKEDLTTMLASMDRSASASVEEDESQAGFDFAGLAAEAESGMEAPVARLAVAIITDALKRRASDIHLEPLEKKFRIRYRVDGVMQEMINPSRKLQGPLITRFKLMAGMDLAEKRVPQDGRIMINVGTRPIDLRASALPGIYGESMVMRILDKTSMLLSMDDLGFLPEDQETWEGLLRYSGGIVLVTGPTGSGKTTTLYTSLSALNTTDRKIMTVEEPVEYQIDGINQSQVRPEIKLTFANILRSLLRQAPDVILVGEIRDFETADIALRAALTGHLVFSTLHTNDATGAPTRLIDLGVEPFLISSSLQGVMAQRLVRTLCGKCKEQYEPDAKERELLRVVEGEELNVCRPVGCKSCNETGYRGRVGIYEIFLMNEELKDFVLQAKASSEVRAAARAAGMRTMGEDGLVKVKKGMTTYSEVVGATNIE